MTVNEIRLALIEEFGINPSDLTFINDAEVIKLYNELMEIKNKVVRA